jgi:hypothetical protein
MADNLVEDAARIVDAAEALNAAVRSDDGRLDVADARRVARACREAEGWLLGIRRLLEVEA